MQKGGENDSPHLRDTIRAMPYLYLPESSFGTFIYIRRS
jgi:hypothetical protein